MRRVLLFTLIILLLPSADMIPTEIYVEWERIDYSAASGYPIIRYPNGNLGNFANDISIFYNSSLIYDDKNNIQNYWLYPFNETISYYIDRIIDSVAQAFYNPIKNYTYLVESDFTVWKYNDTFYINQTSIGGYEGMGVVWYNLTNHLEDFYRPIDRTTKMVYDYKNNVIMLFGGYKTSYFGDTWIFDLNTNQWKQLAQPSHPGIRGYHGITYNENDGKIYLFGGTKGTLVYEDLWVYDYISNTWAEISPLNSPGKRAHHGMIYDSYNNKLLVYRGSLPDLWSYDFKSRYWTFLATNTGPSADYNIFNDWIMYGNSSLIYYQGFNILNLELPISPPGTEIIVTHTETVTTATTSTDYTTVIDKTTKTNYEDITRYQNLTSFLNTTFDETPFYTMGVFSMILAAIVIRRKRKNRSHL